MARISIKCLMVEGWPGKHILHVMLPLLEEFSTSYQTPLGKRNQKVTSDFLDFTPCTILFAVVSPCSERNYLMSSKNSP